MTYEEFLQKLRETPRDWYLREADKAIRHRSEAEPKGVPCPAVRIANSTSAKWPTEHVRWVNWVIEAADKRGAFRPDVRAALLEACGLTEAA